MLNISLICECKQQKGMSAVTFFYNESYYRGLWMITSGLVGSRELAGHASMWLFLTDVIYYLKLQ